MGDTQKLVQRLLIEATVACGDDPLAMERYIRARLETLPEDERRRFEGVAEGITAFRYDGKPPTDPQ